MGSMKEAQKGNFEQANVEIEQGNEIGTLGSSFNIMTNKIHQLMKQNTAVQEEKRKSDLKALRSQINPHFLYNTLDSIIWMAEGEKSKDVVLMTSELAKLLRQSISNDNERIPLEKEIEYTRSYLSIQKMRYRDKLDYEIIVEDRIRKEKVINLILQPLVENAIYHGIKYKGSKGKITIKGWGEDDNIFIRVSDDGIGMDTETLNQTMKKAKERDRTDESEKSGGVGVQNVNTRLRLYYGEKYGLHFESTLGEGTEVTIKIPRYFREENKNEST
jgi:two-component system sensor histidine kinase YesM